MTLSNGHDLRYVDDRQMGQFYYVPDDQIETVPGLAEQGLDVLDDFTFDDFKANLKGFSGEIKGVLTRGRVIAGIGNAYADEILFHAGVYPFKKRRALSDDELRRIHQSSRDRGSGRHRAGASAHGQPDRPQAPRFPRRPQQGRPALPPMRQRHHRTPRQPAHHQLLPNVPTGNATEKLTTTKSGAPASRTPASRTPVGR